MSHRTLAAAIVATIILASCGGTITGSIAPSAPASATPSPSAPASSEVAASPAGASPSEVPASPADGSRSFPTATGIVLGAGRYRSAPPFDIPFTFEVPGTGWESMHLHGEFLDIGRFFGEERQTAPDRWIAWGHPQHVRGTSDQPAAELTPETAAALLVARPELVAGEPEPFSVAGLEGVRVDLHAPEPNTPLFGGPAGDFGLEPAVDARLGIVSVGEELLIVMVLAPATDLETAWTEAQPILDSMEFE